MAVCDPRQAWCFGNRHARSKPLGRYWKAQRLEAAIVIVGAYRAHFARMVVGRGVWFQRERVAAQKIQAAYRGHVSRAWMPTMRRRMRSTMVVRALWRLQCLWRCHVARRELRRKILIRDEAVNIRRAVLLPVPHPRSQALSHLLPIARALTLPSCRSPPRAAAPLLHPRSQALLSPRLPIANFPICIPKPFPRPPSCSASLNAGGEVPPQRRSRHPSGPGPEDHRRLGAPVPRGKGQGGVGCSPGACREGLPRQEAV